MTNPASQNVEHTVREAVEKLFGQKLRRLFSVKGGSNSQSFNAVLSSGKSLFVKFKADAPSHFFLSESRGLKALRDSRSVHVPDVLYAVPVDTGGQLLVQEYLEPTAPTDTLWAEAGSALANLHKHTGPRFGFDAPNFIGDSPQENDWGCTWSEFFVKKRVAFQFDRARRWLSAEVFRSRDRLLTAIGNELRGWNPSPTLVHGDLEVGNLLFSNRRPYYIDPAVYYADREVDLAWSEYLGGIPAPFYAAYAEEFPIDPGYNERKEIYNLYHLLNLGTALGGTFCLAAERSITRLCR